MCALAVGSVGISRFLPRRVGLNVCPRQPVYEKKFNILLDFIVHIVYNTSIRGFFKDFLVAIKEVCRVTSMSIFP